jgi:sugar phosphate isomerase/epimerase
MTRRIGLAALTCLELAPPQLVDAAAAAGYDFVGLRLIPAAAGQSLPPFEPRELERRLADTGMKVLDVEVFRLEASTRIADFEPVMALSRRLGASEILVHGADPDEARLADTFAQLCELAARYRLAANLEPMPWVDVSTVAKAKRILANNPEAALLVDPIHFFRADNRLEELQGAPLRYLQFCDAHAGRPQDVNELIRQARGDRLFPGEGALDLRGLLAALPPELPMGLEIPMARKLEPFQRAKLALEATRKFLTTVPDGRSA